MTSLVESFYGLKKPPFTTSRSSGPVFMTEPLRAAAQFVRDHLEAEDSLVCVSGPAGVGKSSLARSLPRLLGGRWKIASMSGHATCWEDLRRVLLREFGIGHDRITRDGLQEARQKLGRLLIVVDDAQFLSPELLERVCILPKLRTPDDEPVAQLVLLADLDAVERERVRPLLAWLEDGAHHAMRPLEEGEVHRYLDTRLRRVGWTGHPLITDTGAIALHRLSFGNPRALSRAGARLLEMAASRGVSLIDAPLVVACLGEEKKEEPSGIELLEGAAIDDDYTLELDEDWEESVAETPLTAESIFAAPSLELATPARRVHHVECPEGPPLESIRAVAKPPPELPARRFYRPPRTSRWRTLVVLVGAAVVLSTLYIARSEVGDWFARWNVSVPFVAERRADVERSSANDAGREGVENGEGRSLAALGD